MVRAVIDGSADLNALSSKFGTPLCLASLKERMNIIPLLLESRARVNQPGGPFGSALHAACFAANLELVKMLVEAGARVSRVGLIKYDDMEDMRHPDKPHNSGKRTEIQPFTLAIARGHMEAADFLLQSGSNIDATFRQWRMSRPSADVPEESEREDELSGATAVWITVDANYVRALDFLLERGARFDIETDQGWNPLTLATAKGHHECAEALLRAGASPNSRNWQEQSRVVMAVGFRQLRCLSLLIESGADLDQKDDDDCSAMYYAVEGGASDALAEAGAKLDPEIPDQWSMVQLAVGYNFPKCVPILARAGVDLNLSRMGDPDDVLIPGPNRSALMDAAARGHLECVRALVEMEPKSI